MLSGFSPEQEITEWRLINIHDLIINIHDSLIKARLFIFLGLQQFFQRSNVGGRNKNKNKMSQNKDIA